MISKSLHASGSLFQKYFELKRRQSRQKRGLHDPMNLSPASYRTSLSLVTIGVLITFCMVSRGFAEKTSERKVITLEQAYDRTLISDQSVRIAYIEIRKANLLPWGALTKLTPRISAGYSYNHSESKTSSLFDVPSSIGVAGTQNTNLSLQQTLIDFTFFPAYRYARLSGISARLQYQLTIRNVLFGVAKAYYEVLKQQKIVAVDKDTLGLAEKQLQLSQDQYDVGAVSKVDVLRGQSTLESAKQTLISDQNILTLDRDVLANTLNLQGDARNFDVTQPADAAEKAGKLEDDLAQAYANREDYKASSIAIQQNIELRKQVLGQYAPTVSAQFSKNWAETSSSPNSDSWDALVAVQVPIFTGGQREIDLRTAHHNIDEARLNLETAAKNVESDVRTTWLEVQTLHETIQSLEAQVAANEQNYKDLVNQYQAGTATSLDTQTGLIQLVTTRTTLITQIYQYQIALRDLQRSMASFQNKRVKNAHIP